jgi:hypothetical protein
MKRSILAMTLPLFMTTATLAAAMPAGIRLPDGFSRATEFLGVMDGMPIVLQRHMPVTDTGVTLGGPHVSAVRSEGGLLMGFTRMAAALAGRQLPTAKEARNAAEAFLLAAAPELLESYEVNWIKQHDETIMQAGRPVTISGMKVKCRNLKDGRYFWVIVGPDLELITYERNIVWNFAAGYRQTEKWLHDSWLASTGRKFGA